LIKSIVNLLQTQITLADCGSSVYNSTFDLTSSQKHSFPVCLLCAYLNKCFSRYTTFGFYAFYYTKLYTYKKSLKIPKR